MMLCKSKFPRHNIVAEKENQLRIQMCIYQFSPDAHFLEMKIPNTQYEIPMWCYSFLHLELFLVHFVDLSIQNIAASASNSWIGQMVTLK